MNKRDNKASGLHERNVHQNPYDFPALIKKYPDLAPFVHLGPAKQQTINFADAKAVKALNTALLKFFYRINHWDIPDNYLCPPIPGRADYIHHLADLLAESNQGEIPTGKGIGGLDVGTGANVIYPILGSQLYGWQFVGADIDPVSIQTANLIKQVNPRLKKILDFRLQSHPKHTLKNIIGPDDIFHFSMCNPPFHTSAKEASEGSQRKLNNLDKNRKSKQLSQKPQSDLNFGGKSGELWCPGGEATFIKNMIKESVEFKDQCLWFTSLVAKKENLSGIYQALKNAKVVEFKTINMAQGNKMSRFVAWTFQPEDQHPKWFS